MSCFPKRKLCVPAPISARQQGLAGGGECYFCYNFLFPRPLPGDGVSRDAAPAGAEVKISALFVARIPAPAPPGGALGKM